MTLFELPFEGSPQVRNTIQSVGETRVFKSDNLAADLLNLVPGTYATNASASFPSDYIIAEVNYAFDGYENGDVSVPVHVVTVRAATLSAGLADPGTGGYVDVEEFDAVQDIESVSEAFAPDGVNKSYAVPRLIYRRIRFTEAIVSTIAGINREDKVTPLIDRVGKINSSSNDPFDGADTNEWLCVGITARQMTRKLWQYAAEYKHSGRFWKESDAPNKTVSRRTWQEVNDDIIYQTGTIGI